MKGIVLKIADVLFIKNIPFCIYRFPNDTAFHLAVETDILPHQSGLSFISAPFTLDSKAKTIQLHVVESSFFNDNFLSQLEKLSQRPGFDVDIPDETSQEQYFESLNAFLNEINTQQLDKAVLSRVIYEQKPQNFNPLDSFSKLAADYPDTFVHLLFHPKAGLWMGAAPELLLKKEQDKIFVMALAGTQARVYGQSNYHWREKEMEEHLMVGQHIEEVFEKNHCPVLKKEATKTIESGKVAHLRTDYTFQDIGIKSIEKLLSDLHPTPAIGGLPAKKGVECILKYETYDRKYYCGYIGQTDFQKQAEFYVNLRCMQIGKKNIAIFVGGGITAASNPEEEWEETILKSKTMADIIRYPNKTSDK